MALSVVDVFVYATYFTADINDPLYNYIGVFFQIARVCLNSLLVERLYPVQRQTAPFI